MVTTSCRKSSWVKSSSTESRLSDRKLKPLPPDPFRHQDSAIARNTWSGSVLRRRPMRTETLVVADIEAVKDKRVLEDWRGSKWPPPVGWHVVAIGMLVAR